MSDPVKGLQNSMTRTFAERAEEKRHEGETLIREADNL
jgi:hypothetical protein